jgi:hypothetical protein
MALSARAAGSLCLLIAACADNPYVIGHARDVHDAAADSQADASFDAGLTTCSEALVCSGFERELRADWTDIAVEGSGQVDRVTTRSHSGAGSLHASTRSVESVADVVARFAALRSGSLYLRAYLYVPAGLPTDVMNVFFIGSRPDPLNDEPFVGVDLNLVAGALQLFSPQATPTRQTGVLEIPRDRWFCLRAELEIGSDAGASVYIEDALALRATGIDSSANGGVTMMRAGIDWSSSQDAFFELFMDDLVLDTQPVGCLAD